MGKKSKRPGRPSHKERKQKNEQAAAEQAAAEQAFAEQAAAEQAAIEQAAAEQAAAERLLFPPMDSAENETWLTTAPTPVEVERRRERMNQLMKCFVKIPASSDPSKEGRRVSCLRAYNLLIFACMKNAAVEGSPVTREDFEFVKKIRKSSTEPPVIRATAFHSAVFLSLAFGGHNDVRGHALIFYDELMRVCDSTSEEEKARPLILANNAGTTVGAVLGELQTAVRQQFQALDSDSDELDALTPTGRKRKVPFYAGMKCDFCPNVRSDFCPSERSETCTLKTCARCEMAYYCKEDCQKRAWREDGHKIVCRKRGEFRVGDIAASLDPLETGDVYIGKLVRIKAPAPTVGETNQVKPSRWVVEACEDSSIVQIVPSKNLRRVRPALWNGVV